jgi:hypothetical protein
MGALQVCAAAGALTLALAALLSNTHPGERSLRAGVAFLLLVAGLIATFGAMNALVELGERERIGVLGLLGWGTLRGDYPYTVLVCVYWTLIVLTAAYLGLVVDVIRSLR